jgi:hypothetical protein
MEAKTSPIVREDEGRMIARHFGLRLDCLGY